MTDSITIKQALETWTAHQRAQDIPGEHIPTDVLYELLIHPDMNDPETAQFKHLIHCARCLQELKEMVEGIREAEQRHLEAWDLALPKAASSHVEWPKKIPTEGGKYTIEIRRTLGDPTQGVMTVQVEEKYRTVLEGKIIRVTDGAGRLLLKGQISDGQVSQRIEGGLDEVVPQFQIQSVS